MKKNLMKMKVTDINKHHDGGDSGTNCDFVSSTNTQGYTNQITLNITYYILWVIKIIITIIIITNIIIIIIKIIITIIVVVSEFLHILWPWNEKHLVLA